MIISQAANAAASNAQPVRLWQHEETGRLTLCVQQPHRYFLVPKEGQPEITGGYSRPDGDG